jgi:5-methylcytosine-specific restriction endonuclease McrA
MGRPAAPIGTRQRDPAGYVRIKLPDHPLSIQGWVREHQLVLFDAIGAGIHPCHYCGVEIEWGSTLEVDHVDRDRGHNAVGNLVPACRLCNNARRQRRRRRAPR